MQTIANAVDVQPQLPLPEAAQHLLVWPPLAQGASENSGLITLADRLLERAAMRKSISVFAALVVLVTLVSPVRAETRTIPARALKADYEILHQALVALHPGLLRYNTAMQMDVHFQQLRDALSHDQTLSDAYLRFSEFAATIQCGHTYLNFSNQPVAVAREVFSDALSVPFEFVWLNGRMVVTRNASTNAALVPGTQILAIDGIATAEVLAKLLLVARADGANEAKRIDYLQLSGREEIEAFDVYFPLYFPAKSPDLQLSVLAPGMTAPATAVVQRVTAHARRTAAPSAIHSGGDGRMAWHLSIKDSSTAVLTMPTWALYNSKRDWKADLTATFAQLSHQPIQSLIIDLRGNEGGDAVGDEIVAHLVIHSLRKNDVTRRVRYRKIPDQLAPFLDTWDPSFKDWGDVAVPDDDGFYRLGASERSRTIQPLAPHFDGDVIVLVGAANSSATFEFAQLIQKNKLGRLIGQPTGGNLRGINGGAFFFLRLPNTGIEVDLPLIGIFPSVPMPNAGLVPDIPVLRTVDAIAAGTDLEMEKALGLATVVAKPLPKPPR
ncbi:MAG: S41 family peptidase [Pseudomonadota bacterium]|nr:S41 family peptidase [Pseudomonadota bacterium]